MSHRQKRRWPAPQADLVLDMTFCVHHVASKMYHAEVTIEIPVEDGTEYFSFGVSMHTERAALRRLIERIESSQWFHLMRDRGVRFRVFGVLEETYRGYL